MKLLILGLFFVVLLGRAQSDKIKFKDCGSEVGAIKEVSVDPCSSFPCILHKGKNYSISVTFTANEDANVTRPKVDGEISGLKVPFPVPNPDGCAGGKSGLKCPLKVGSTYTYVNTLYVSPLYPSIKVVVDWALMDAKTGGKKLFCFQTLVAIAA